MRTSSRIPTKPIPGQTANVEINWEPATIVGVDVDVIVDADPAHAPLAVFMRLVPGLAYLARTGFFKPVHMKSLSAHAAASVAQGLSSRYAAHPLHAAGPGGANSGDVELDLDRSGMFEFERGLDGLALH